MDVNANNKSEFNDAVGFLKRLDDCFKEANMASASNDVMTWHSALTVLYLELYNYLPDKDGERKIKEKELKEIKELCDGMYRKWKGLHPSKQTINKDIYWKLFDFHTYLKKVYGDSGLETRVVDNAMKALR